MERLGLSLLLVQFAALAAYVNAGTATLPLYRSKSPGLDPDSHRSSHNVVCELHLLLRLRTALCIRDPPHEHYNHVF